MSGLLGLAHVLGYLQVGEDQMEEDDEDAPACANALKVKQHGGLSASSGLLGLACILDFLWVGEDRMEEEEGEDAPMHANVHEVKWHGSPSVPSRCLGFAPGHDHFAGL